MPPKVRGSLIALALIVLVPGLPAQGQGIIIDRWHPERPLARTFEVAEVSVDARVRDQVAEVRVSQTFHNPGSTQLESEYLFPVPDDGAIQNFVLMVDGRELPGKLLPKDEARRIFEEIVRTRRDPALLEYMGLGVFKTSVFPIPPGADRTVTLRYTQLLRRDRDVVELTYPFGTQKFTAKPIRRLALSVDIDSKEPIKSLYSPGQDVEIRRDGDHHATVKLVRHDITPTEDFRLVYTLAEGSIGASVLSYRPSEGDDGYFLLLASPEVKKSDDRPRAKTVILVLDRSGSMSGKKIEQARKALTFVLDNLRKDDTFNIIAYDDRVETYKPELQRYGREARADAVRWVENIAPGGSTNIDGALRAAFESLRDDDRPQYVLFLTDGLPTAGVTGEGAIAERAREANKTHARLFVFGVGYDVNARLLDRLSGNQGGTSEYVKPDEDIEAHVSRFYTKLTSPVLTRLSIEIDGTDVNRTYPRDLPDLFDGGQIVWVGRYRRSGRVEVTIKGKVGSDRQTIRTTAELADAGRGTSYDFVERLWAVRRVGFLIDQIDLHGKSRELTEELVALSTRYGILTPYTAFLADERVRLDDRLSNNERAGRNLEQLGMVEGAAAVAQRANKQSLLQADRALAPNSRRLYEYRDKSQAQGFASGGGRREGGFEVAQSRAGEVAPASPSDGQQGQPSSVNGPVALKAQSGVRSAPLGSSTTQLPALGARPAVAQDAQGETIALANVRQLGTKTFYRKAGRWIDSAVTPEDEAKAIDLEPFSEPYFDLARRQTAEENQYLTFEEPVTVKLAGQVYRINRATP